MNNLEQRGHDAHEIHKTIVKYCKKASELFIFLGEAFTYVDENKIYEDLGYDNFTDYVDGHEEVTVSSSTAYKAMAIYKKCVVQLDIDLGLLAKIGVKNLDLICSKLNEDNQEEMLANADTQRFSELRKTYPPKPQNQELHSDFFTAARYMYSALQNLLDERPDLRDEIHLAGSTLSGLKELLK